MFNRLKIASKLLIGFGLLLLLLAGVSAISAIGSLKSRDFLEDVARRKSNEILDQQIQKEVVEASMDAWITLATGNQELWKQSDVAMKSVDKHIAALSTSTMDSGRLEKVKQLAALIQNFKNVESQLRAVHGQNEALDTADNKALSASAIKIGTDILTYGKVLSDEWQNVADTTESNAKEEASFVVDLAIGVGFLSVLIGLSLSFLITRSIKQPILTLTHVMGALVKGDLQVAIPNTTESNEIGEMAKAVLVFRDAAVENARLEREAAEHRAQAERERARNEQAQREAIERERAIVADSIGVGLNKLAAKDLTYRMSSEIPEAYRKLRSDFNAAIGQLEEALQGVTDGTNAIHAGTEQMSTAADDLSRRTEQQAASLEETAAALEEITSTVKKSAEGATHAREVVAAADDDAKKSALVVRQAVEAMDAIAKSAQQISQIIGVIDEIAFQTNLLALNAGVEAARAGDAGRGFAVVASEVRALAQRSAEAAKEIKGLITASTRQVESGVKLVGETGALLERIMAQVTEINAVVGNIAAGAKEQATGIGEVNTAINQMDQMTQQNSAMVEESTAATHSLSQETAQLSGLIGQFQVGRTDANASMRRELQKVAPHAFRQKPEAAVPMGGRAETRKTAARPVRAMSKAMAANGRTVSADDTGWKEF